MDIMVLIDKLEDVLADSKRVPMTTSILINEHKLAELLEEIRQAIPQELKEARWIIREQQEMKEETEKESQRILEDARQKASEQASDTEIVRLAEKQAADILDSARAREREIRMGAEDYADELFANVEISLGKSLSLVQRARDRLHGKIDPRQ